MKPHFKASHWDINVIQCMYNPLMFDTCTVVNTFEAIISE